MWPISGHDKVTVGGFIAGWSDLTRASAAGRCVLALQDTSGINFSTTPSHRYGLDEIGKGSGRGLFGRAMLAVDADAGDCHGLVAGDVHTRQGRVETSHAKRALKDKESRCWVVTAEQAKEVLVGALMFTVAADRESDIYTQWVSQRPSNFHFIGRADAWQIVDWYRLRWTIEQLLRLTKTDGLKLEDSQLESAGALLKLAAIAMKAAATIL